MDDDKIHISIIGMCVPRDVFGMADKEGKFVVDRYVQSVNPVSAVSASPLRKDLNIPGGDTDWIKAKSKFHLRNATIDLEKSLFSYVSEVKSDWLVIDFGCLRNNLFHFSDDTYATIPLMQTCPGFLTEGYLDEKRSIVSVLTMDSETLNRSLDIYIEKILDLYPQNQIILFESYASYWYVDKKRQSCYVDNVPIANKFNKIFRRSFIHAIKKMPHVHVVRFPSHVIADEGHKWGRSPLHYTHEYYQYAYEAVKIIVNSNDESLEQFDLCRLQIQYEEVFRKYAPYKEKFLSKWDIDQKRKGWMVEAKDWLKEFIEDNRLQNLDNFVRKNKIKSVALYGLSDVCRALVSIFKSLEVKVDYIVENSMENVKYYKEIPLISRDFKHYPTTECMIITDLRVDKVRRKLEKMNLPFEIQDIYSILDDKNTPDEPDILENKIEKQICKVINGKLCFQLFLRENIAAIYEFSLYQGKDLWEKRPPAQKPAAEFTINDELKDGEYYISYKVKSEGMSRTYQTPKFKIRRID